MISEIQSLLDSYVDWLRDKTVLRKINEWVEITTPYLDRHNDYIQIYAKKNNGGFLLTDDRDTINDLEMSGCKIESQKRLDILKTVLNGFGVQETEGAIQVQASPSNFALRKHNLVQAILAVNDMFYLASPYVESLFYEDVVAWLDENDISYFKNVKLSGKSGYDNHFEFVIGKTRRMPERIIKTINRPSKETAKALAFAWIDTKEVRPSDSRVYALLNDSETKIQLTIIEALKSYDLKPVQWSKRRDVRDELAA
ncbi:DUF1829 domain-containing protein [bacterium]|nr:DUF1829 domain-containing protein [bacterium]